MMIKSPAVPRVAGLAQDARVSKFNVPSKCAVPAIFRWSCSILPLTPPGGHLQKTEAKQKSGCGFRDTSSSFAYANDV